MPFPPLYLFRLLHPCCWLPLNQRANLTNVWPCQTKRDHPTYLSCLRRKIREARCSHLVRNVPAARGNRAREGEGAENVGEMDGGHHSLIKISDRQALL